MKNDNRVNLLFLVTLEKVGNTPEIEVLNQDWFIVHSREQELNKYLSDEFEGAGVDMWSYTCLKFTRLQILLAIPYGLEFGSYLSICLWEALGTGQSYTLFSGAILNGKDNYF